MNLYLDDDSADRRLVAELRKAGHTVVLPIDVDLAGASDARHLAHAIRQSSVVLTRNHDDFVDLHEMIQASSGKHHGILVVRYDNDPSRDMTARGICAAIAKLGAAGVPIANQVHILN